MRKVLLGLLLTATVALAVGLPAAADPNGDQAAGWPGCADISQFDGSSGGGTASYVVPATDNDPTTRGPAEVNGSFYVNGNIADCPKVTYSMWVYWQKDGNTYFRVETSSDGGFDNWTGVFSQRVPAGIPTVYVAFTTSKGFTLIDAAPNSFIPPSTGGVPVNENAGSPGGGGAAW
jgi:hypothetical protein